MEIQPVLPAFLLNIKLKLALFKVLILLVIKLILIWGKCKMTGIFASIIIRTDFMTAYLVLTGIME